MVVAWRRDSCLGPAEIAPFVFLVLFKDWDPVWVQDFVFLFLMLIKGVRRRCEFKIFLLDPRDGKNLLKIFRKKIENVLWEWEVGCVLRSRVRGTCNSRLILGEISIFLNLKLEPVMRHVTCGDQQILLMVIWLVQTGVKTDEISYERLGSYFSWTCFRGWEESVRSPWNCIYCFGGLLLEGSNAEKWVDHQKKKFFINNSDEAVILFQ